MGEAYVKPCPKCGLADRYPTYGNKRGKWGACRPCSQAREQDPAHKARVREKYAADAEYRAKKLARSARYRQRPEVRARRAARDAQARALRPKPPRAPMPEGYVKPCIKCGAQDRWPPKKPGGTGACRACLRVYQQKYYAENREKIRERNARPEVRERQRARARRPDVREKSRETTRAWRHSDEGRAWLRAYSRMRHCGGLTPEEQHALYESQKGLCASCGDKLRPGRQTHLDHDHATGKARGYLCRCCNIAIAHLKDSPLRARKLAAYLEKHSPTLPLVDLGLRRVDHRTNGQRRPSVAAGDTD